VRIAAPGRSVVRSGAQLVSSNPFPEYRAGIQETGFTVSIDAASSRRDGRECPLCNEERQWLKL
jgi:hypothetical protein